MLKKLEDILKKSGWFKGRKINLENRLPSDYDLFPEKVCQFLEEFIGLELTNKFESTSVFRGIEERGYVNCKLIIDPMEGFGFNEENDGDFWHYSSIIGTQLYPIGRNDENWFIGMDDELNMYVLNVGFCCYRVSQDPN